MIERVSQEVVTYLRVEDAHDGTAATLGRETYVETIREPEPDYDLFLTRRPIASITSAVVDGVTLVSGTDYLINNNLGSLSRLDNDEVSTWDGDKIVVTYVAGYLLPDDVNRTLPYQIEEAALYAIQSRMQDLQPDGCDREVKSEAIPGVYSATYETSGSRAHDRGGFLPDRAIALLAPYRRIML